MTLYIYIYIYIHIRVCVCVYYLRLLKGIKGRLKLFRYWLIWTSDQDYTLGTKLTSYNGQAEKHLVVCRLRRKLRSPSEKEKKKSWSAQKFLKRDFKVNYMQVFH